MHFDLILKWKIITYAEMYQNRAAGYTFAIGSKYSTQFWRNDCSSVFLAKWQPAALWEQKNDDTYKKKMLHFVAQYKWKNCLLYAKQCNSGPENFPDLSE